MSQYLIDNGADTSHVGAVSSPWTGVSNTICVTPGSAETDRGLQCLRVLLEAGADPTFDDSIFEQAFGANIHVRFRPPFSLLGVITWTAILDIGVGVPTVPNLPRYVLQPARPPVRGATCSFARGESASGVYPDPRADHVYVRTSDLRKLLLPVLWPFA